MLKEVLVGLSVILLVCCLSVTAHAMADQKSHVKVPAGDLTAGLELLARQSGAEFVYSADQLKGLRTHGVAGDLSAKDAVTKLLEGTKLEVRMDASGAMLIAPPAATAQESPRPGDDSTQEGKSKSSGNFLLAQATPGQTSGDVSVDKEDQQASKKKTAQIEEVLVTGSRIPTAAKEAAQEVRVYNREKIEQSGQTTVADFLNTLPDVSVAQGESGAGTQGNFGITSVQLHGLPVGTTLVLINGRRVEASGISGSGTSTFFDLSNIPLAAVERLEVISEGSSAVYGSDAIAGVVNVILKKDFDGVETNAKYGWASGTNEWDGNAAWGKHWTDGSVSLIADYQTQSQLIGFDRSLTANQNYTALGGIDNRVPVCDPGNIFSASGAPLTGLGTATFAAVPSAYTGSPSIAEFQATAGSLNKCSLQAYTSYIPASQRLGVFATASVNVTPSLEFFTELMYSHVKITRSSAPPELVAVPGYSEFTVSASNPYNPFGETVGVGDLLTSLGSSDVLLETAFYRPLIGARGHFSSWEWEAAAWDSEDHSNLTSTNFVNINAVQDSLNSTNPATALNPFVPGPQSSEQLLKSLVFNQLNKYSGQQLAAGGFLRGPLVDLNSGPLQLVLGSEYTRDKLYSDIINEIPYVPPNTQTDDHRTNYAVFAEARVPIVGKPAGPESGDTLALSLAERYDHYDDFGGRSTPQLGAEWRPIDSLLIRGTYGQSFRAPDLPELYMPLESYQTVVVNPSTGTTVPITEVFGGNPQLRPETGQSRTFGIVYSSRALSDLRLSVTHWAVDENNSIQLLPPQTIVDNAVLFPGHVIRNPAGVITEVNDTFVNFGLLSVAGFDYRLDYRQTTAFGVLTPSISATQTSHYRVSLTPMSPPTDADSKAQDTGDWAPRWKATLALGWKLSAYSVSVTARYTGRYQDYDSTREIGNFWLFDANGRYAVGQVLESSNPWLKGSFIELGGVNILNTLPQFSNYYYGDFGYDPAQADIRGRFLYVHIGSRW